MQIAYGLLSTLLKFPDDTQVAVVLPYKEVGRMSEKNCELVETTNHLIKIHPNCLIKTVSIVHDCNKNCTITTTASVTKEREEINTDKYFSVQHDYEHNQYCINKYCMSSI